MDKLYEKNEKAEGYHYTKLHKDLLWETEKVLRPLFLDLAKKTDFVSAQYVIMGATYEILLDASIWGLEELEKDVEEFKYKEEKII